MNRYSELFLASRAIKTCFGDDGVCAKHFDEGGFIEQMRELAKLHRYDDEDVADMMHHFLMDRQAFIMRAPPFFWDLGELALRHELTPPQVGCLSFIIVRAKALNKSLKECIAESN